MPKYSNFAIVASFMGLWLNSFFSQELQLIVGFILILSFGILHGANDLALIKNVNSNDRVENLYKILLYYIIIVLIGATLFYLIPWLALTLFIIFSGYHFGEQQWNEQLKIEAKWLKFIYEMLYGLIILFLIFTFHDVEVQKIILAITTIEVPIFTFLLILKILLSFFTLLSILFYFRIERFKNYFFKELFYLLVFSIIFKVSSLIWGFALYFIFWHSIPSMIDQIRFLFGNVSFNNFKLYFRSAFAYWIISLLGIALLYYVFKDQKIFNALFFSFLASITFPHVVVIVKMFGKK
ncbi:Brp/Blh family beta-carotene 15,15'-dioxygenase [Flavobacterium sp.]|jgi:Brp/Blh family beta-carotene 15,15'-monooxygenase|uniref:Brp/Blh family beta-carotene 15,15'-dioxygenase n=1 Tax=Flavobacterium sp. TaxID=239 RepID=UPI0037C1752A